MATYAIAATSNQRSRNDRHVVTRSAQDRDGDGGILCEEHAASREDREIGVLVQEEGDRGLKREGPGDQRHDEPRRDPRPTDGTFAGRRKEARRRREPRFRAG